MVTTPCESKCELTTTGLTTFPVSDGVEMRENLGLPADSGELSRNAVESGLMICRHRTAEIVPNPIVLLRNNERAKLVNFGTSILKSPTAQCRQADVSSVSHFDLCQEVGVPASGSLIYIMSKEGYLTDQPPHNLNHLMYDLPRMDGTAWGANLPGVPIYFQQLNPARITEFYDVMGNWSDGVPVN
jgi:hypothetical protein